MNGTGRLACGVVFGKSFLSIMYGFNVSRVVTQLLLEYCVYI